MDLKNGAGRDEEEEVLSPLKNPTEKSDSGSLGAADASRQLFQGRKDDSQIILRKRKAKGSSASPSLMPDLNVPAPESAAIVPVGLVTERVNQLGKNAGDVGAGVSEVSPKKQKRSKSQTNVTSAAAVSSSPRRAQ